MMQLHSDTMRHFIERMPSLSTTATKVVEICNHPSASPVELNRVITLDPVLAGSVLKLVNSAYYSFPSRITSLTKAIIMLGINTVKNLVLAVSILAVAHAWRSSKVMAMDDFWAHCLAVGVIAKSVAKRLTRPVQDPELYFMAGLLHDLGKLPLLACFPDIYIGAIKAAQEQGIALFTAERNGFGVDHIQIGCWITEKWKLDGPLRLAIAGHHLLDGQEHDPTDPTLATVVGLANAAAYHFNIGSAGDLVHGPTQLPTWIHACGLAEQDLVDIQPMIELEIEKAKVFLQPHT